MDDSLQAKTSAPKLVKRTENLRSRIYQEIRNQIQMGLVGADDRLVDTEIAAQHGISRMPVREALLQLTNEGYLATTTRGFVLPRLSAADVADIFEVRRLLEPRAAANAARDMTDAAAEALLAALGDAETAVAEVDGKRLSLANAQFRNTWIGVLKNERLAETLGRFSDQVQVVRAQTLDHPETQRVVLRGLRRLCDAFMQRDTMAAHDRMTAFIADAEEYFIASLRLNR